MRRFLLVGLVATMAVVYVTAASATTTLKFITKETSTKETAKGFIFKEDVLQNGSKVGTDRGVCKYIIPSGADQPTGASCVITISLADGKIILSAELAFDANGGPVKVTGGTGEYANASGTGTYRNKPNNRTAVTLHLN